MTSPYPKYSLTASPVPGYVMSAVPAPSFVMEPDSTLEATQELHALRLEMQENKRREEFEELPETTDYSYDEEHSYYTSFRNRLEELKLGWPLTEKEEYDIERHTNSNNTDNEIQLIKHAYLKGDLEQQSVMRSLAKKMNYTL